MFVGHLMALTVIQWGYVRGNCLPTFWGHRAASKRRQPNKQLRSVKYQ